MRVVEGNEEGELPEGPIDVLIVLHALRSAWAVEAASRLPKAPRIVVGLAGTDVYRRAARGEEARGLEPDVRRILERADRIVALQPAALEELDVDLRSRGRVIWQSARPVERVVPDEETFDVLLLGHLRAVKDPLLSARAVRELPVDSRVRVVCAGAALDAELGEAARNESKVNPRWTWVGEVEQGEARRLLGQARVLLITSLAEGGANAISEALASGIPVLATEVPGNVGMLGRGYPGLFPVGDVEGLAAMLLRAECEEGFLAGIEAACQGIAGRHAFEGEVAAWGQLLSELA